MWLSLSGKLFPVLLKSISLKDQDFHLMAVKLSWMKIQCLFILSIIYFAFHFATHQLQIKMFACFVLVLCKLVSRQWWNWMNVTLTHLFFYVQQQQWRDKLRINNLVWFSGSSNIFYIVSQHGWNGKVACRSVNTQVLMFSKLEVHFRTH